MGTAIIVVIIGALWAWIESGKKQPVTKSEPKPSNMTMEEALQAQAKAQAKAQEGPMVQVPINTFYQLVGNQVDQQAEKPKQKPKPKEKIIYVPMPGQPVPAWGQGHPVNNHTLYDRSGNPVCDRNGNPITLIPGNNGNGNGGNHHGY